MSGCDLKISFLLISLIFVSSGEQVFKISVRLAENANDTILEFYQNCTCTAFFGCGIGVLEHMQLGLDGKLPVKCSDEVYWCCRNTYIPPEEPSAITTTEKPASMTVATMSSATTTTKKPVTPATESSTTVEWIDPRPKNVVNLTCGLPRTSLTFRVLNPELDSQTTIPGEMPWMVEIFQNRNRRFEFKCAGTLIHPQVVLTAQHCVRSNRETSLKVLANDRGPFRDLGFPELERNVLKIIKHPDYYSGALHNDIALLILDEPYIYINHMLNSVCLPEQGQNFNGKKCLGIGWGQNRRHRVIPLRKVDVPVVEPRQCESLLRRTHLGEDFELHSSFMCAGGEEGKDTCKGDGGGPLICMDNYRFVQAGIISWGVEVERCGQKDQPGIYTDVAQFRDWIVDQLATENIVIK